MIRKPADAQDLVLPETLQVIEDEAFAGIAAAVIKCPETLKTIGERSFAGYSSLRQIYIPDSTETIADSAFDGCSDWIVIFGRTGSEAQRYAEKKGMEFIAVR